MLITESGLRRIIRRTILAEKFKTAMDRAYEKTGHRSAYSAAADPKAQEAWKKSLKAFSEQPFAERWNKGWTGKILFKIPGKPGAENYGWDNFALDVVLLMPFVGGPIGKGIVSIGKLAGGKMAPQAVKSLGMALAILANKSPKAAALLAKVGTSVAGGAGKAAAGKGGQAIGSTAVAEAVKELYAAAENLVSSDDKIEIEINKDQLIKAKGLIAKKTGKVMSLPKEISVGKTGGEAPESIEA